MSGVAHDRVRVTTFVAVTPETAFDVFTRDSETRREPHALARVSDVWRAARAGAGE